MEATSSLNRARGTSRTTTIGIFSHADPGRVLGVVDGLVSVTQRAWGLIPVTQHRIRVMQ
jgi:hypothetical protein